MTCLYSIMVLFFSIETTFFSEKVAEKKIDANILNYHDKESICPQNV